jgi:hypothetical protein
LPGLSETAIDKDRLAFSIDRGGRYIPDIGLADEDIEMQCLAGGWEEATKTVAPKIRIVSLNFMVTVPVETARATPVIGPGAWKQNDRAAGHRSFHYTRGDIAISTTAE